MASPWPLSFRVALALAAGVATGAAPLRAGETPPLGASVAELHFVDTRGLPRTSKELGEFRALAVMFATTDCPLARRYLPRFVELETKLRGRGVQFLVVNVGPLDSVGAMAEAQVECGAAFPFVKDFDGAVAKALGAARTPHFMVLDGAHKLVYRGRFDAQYRLGGVNPSAGRADLELALEDVLAQRAVEVAQTAVEGCALEDLGPPAPRPDLTWSRDIAGIVQRACQDCHRPQTAAPFALLTHADVARRAATVAEVVREGRMPPWFASPRHGAIVNAPALSAEERDMLVGWALAGAPAGDLAQAPPPREFSSRRWRIAAPDLVLEQAKASEVPASGYVPYRYIVFSHVFTHDTWVEAIEIATDNPRVVHHANLGFFKFTEGFKNENFLTGYVPGGDPLECGPNVAVLIPAGSLVGLQTHFVTTGSAERAKLSVGLRFPRAKVEQRMQHFQIQTSRFEIPPFAPAHPVRAQRKFAADSVGVGMFAHMHLRGRDMTFTANYPDGREEILLRVPNYSFDWQQSYRWAPSAQRFPAETRVQVLAHFDNSTFNPYNPDPSAAVRYGQQTVDEMMMGFLFFVEEHQRLGLDIDPATGRAR
jgi:hypothetical protein